MQYFDINLHKLNIILILFRKYCIKTNKAGHIELGSLSMTLRFEESCMWKKGFVRKDYIYFIDLSTLKWILSIEGIFFIHTKRKYCLKNISHINDEKKANKKGLQANQSREDGANYTQKAAAKASWQTLKVYTIIGSCCRICAVDIVTISSISSTAQAMAPVLIENIISG